MSVGGSSTGGSTTGGTGGSTGGSSSSSSGGSNSCQYANDGVCDEPSYCETGTDTSDCEASEEEANGDTTMGGDTTDTTNSCEYAYDDVCDEPTYCETGTDTSDCERRRRLFSVEGKAAHTAPHEWEEWTTHDYFRHVGSDVIAGGEHTGTHLLETEPELRFYYHRATGQTKWHPPKGWDPAQARQHQHQRSSRTASRKLLSATDGEGRLCKPSGADPPGPGVRDEAMGLEECPSDMRCEPLDPMFCPDKSFCTDWDCKCYGPGNNDNTTISGVLGLTVIDGDKSTLSCGCGTEEVSGVGKTRTAMPFEWKKHSDGKLVMDYQCCDDYFDGYQCTLWNYTAEPGGSSCLSMYDDHKMKACAATVCCSSYTEDFTRAYPGPWDDGGSGPGDDQGPGPNSCESWDGWLLAFNGYCEEPWDCERGTDTEDCANSCEYAWDYECDEPWDCEPGTDTADCGGSMGPGGPGDPGPGGGGGGGGEECFVDIYESGTFIGSFHPWGHDETPNLESQLLSKGGADRLRPTSSASSAGPPDGSGTASLRMNEKFFFRGKFVPDSAPSDLKSGRAPSTSESRPSAAPDILSPYTAYDDVVAPATDAPWKFAPARAAPTQAHSNVLSPDSSSGQHAHEKPRDREARGNAPGAPGGKDHD